MTNRTKDALNDLTTLLSAKLRGLSIDEGVELLEELSVDVEAHTDVLKHRQKKDEG